MSSIEGQIMSGDFDDEMNVFSLKKIKQFQTQTSLKENQLKALQHYLRQSMSTMRTDRSSPSTTKCLYLCRKMI
nr:hypothetical protein [Bacillus licheniformis]